MDVGGRATKDTKAGARSEENAYCLHEECNNAMEAERSTLSDAAVILHLCVAVLDKDAAIAFTLRLDMKHHSNADTDTLNWLMYKEPVELTFP